MTDNSGYDVGTGALPATGIPYVIVNGTIVDNGSKVLKDVYPGPPTRNAILDQQRRAPTTPFRSLALRRATGQTKKGMMHFERIYPSRAAAWRPAQTTAELAAACLFIASATANAQQFNGDNQWVGPYGVATLVGVAGEDYSQFIATATLIPEYEFNIGFTHYYDDPVDGSGSYTANNLYVKKRLSENDAGTTGYALMAGTGLWPEHQSAFSGGACRNSTRNRQIKLPHVTNSNSRLYNLLKPTHRQRAVQDKVAQEVRSVIG